MTQEEMRATGVSSLSKHKLEELNHWLTRFVALEAGLLKDQASVVTIASESIQTSISGQFTGWKGDTVFRLDNGQIWKQRIPGSWRTNKQNPQVTLSLNALNLWELTVIENNRKIGVKRLK